MTDGLILITDIEPLADSELYRSGYARIPEIRRRRLDRYRQETDRRRCVAAGLLLSEAMRRLGENPEALEYYIEDGGRPRYRNRPDLIFSLSHSGERVMCAAMRNDSGDWGIGCDVEKVGDAAPKIAERFYTIRERELLQAQDTVGRQAQRMFYRIWTMKESFLKVTGKGMRLPLNSFTVRPEEGDFWSVEQSFDLRRYTGREYCCEEEYCYSVVTAQCEAPELFVRVDCREL